MISKNLSGHCSCMLIRTSTISGTQRVLEKYDCFSILCIWKARWVSEAFIQIKIFLGKGRKGTSFPPGYIYTQWCDVASWGNPLLPRSWNGCIFCFIFVCNFFIGFRLHYWHLRDGGKDRGTVLSVKVPHRHMIPGHRALNLRIRVGHQFIHPIYSI
jgi:hypothetical protein